MAIGEYIPVICQKALGYASLGMAVFPLYGANEHGCACGDKSCKSPGKHPRTANGFNDASSDPKLIKEWFAGAGLKNIGIRTGIQFWVLDVDEETPEDWPALDAGWIAKTPRGGFHYFFALPPGETFACSIGKLAPKIDVRGDGGYVAAFPSVGINGKYTWHKDKQPGLSELSEAPGWLVEKIIAISSEQKEKLDPALEVSEGGRNDYLFRLASSLRAQGIASDLAQAQILHAASRCKPPLPESEALAIVQNVYNRYPANAAIKTVERRPEGSKEFPLTDLGNAERLIYRLDGNVRWCEAFGKWLLWDGSIWKVDETGGALLIQECADMARDMSRQANESSNEVERKQLRSWALKCESSARIGSIMNLAPSLRGVPVSPDDLDRNPMLFACASGTIDLATGLLKEPNKLDLMTLSSPVEWDKDAECPTFEKFLSWCLQDDEELVDFIQCALGYTLTGLTSEQTLFFCHGSGDNGKSTFLDAFAYVMGDYAKTIPAEELMSQKNGKSIETTLARLKSARMVRANETNNGSLAEATVKEIVGGETIQARMLYGHPFEYKPSFKLWIAGNHKPKINNNDWGIWRRIRLVPFLNKIDEAEKDVRLSEKLRAEAPGILRFCVVGLTHYLSNRLPTSTKIVEATQAYRDDMDVLGEFIDDNCETGHGLSVTVGSLYTKYQSWAEQTGHAAMSQTSFSQRMQDRGFERTRTMRARLFAGIALNDQETEAKPWAK